MLFDYFPPSLEKDTVLVQLGIVHNFQASRSNTTNYCESVFNALWGNGNKTFEWLVLSATTLPRTSKLHTYIIDLDIQKVMYVIHDKRLAIYALLSVNYITLNQTDKTWNETLPANLNTSICIY